MSPQSNQREWIVPQMARGVLADWEIKGLAMTEGMISPFVGHQTKHVADGDGLRPVISYGLSSFGYDARLDRRFKLYHPWGGTIDPKAATADWWIEHEAEGQFTLPAGQYALACTVERFRLPDDIFALCIGKSTYARCGLVVNTTPLEPGWEGQLTLELFNAAPMPIRLWPGEGICQIVFLRGETPEITYGRRRGKYQGQEGVVGPRL